MACEVGLIEIEMLFMSQPRLAIRHENVSCNLLPKASSIGVVIPIFHIIEAHASLNRRSFQ